MKYVGIEYFLAQKYVFLLKKSFPSLFGSVSAHQSNISLGPRGPPPRGRRDWNQNYMEHLENNPDKKIAKRQKKSNESTLASQIMNFFSHADTI